MSQLEYYTRDPRSNLPHSGGLMAWGVVMIVFGALAALFGVISIFMIVVVMNHMIPTMPQQSAATYIMAVFVYAVISALLFWLGFGSCKGRRWVRPLMVVGSALMMASGLLSIVTWSIVIVGFIQHPSAAPVTPGAPALPFNPMLVGFIMGGCGSVLFLLGLPIAIIWFYRRESVKTTLEIMDPHPRWTDGRSLTSLAWIIGNVVLGAGMLFGLAKGVYPFFTTVLVGFPAYGLICMLGLLLIVGGVLSYRQSSIGWLLGVCTLMILAASITTFAIAGPSKIYFDLLFAEMPAQQRQLTDQITAGSLYAPVVMYFAALGYGIWVRKEFDRPQSTSTEPHTS
jgi:hypothetical protein